MDMYIRDILINKDLYMFYDYGISLTVSARKI